MRKALGRVVSLLPERVSSQLRGADYRYSPSDVPPPPMPRPASRRLYIGPVNYAEQGYQWARAAETLPDTSATSMQFRYDEDFGFQVDNPVPVRVFRFSRRWQRRQFDAVSSRYTHVIFEAGKPLFGSLFDDDPAREVLELRRRGVVVAMLSHGSDLRQPSRHRHVDRWSPFFDGTWERMPEYEEKSASHRRLLAQVGAPVFVSTPDLLLDWPSARWLPTVVDPMKWATDARPLQRERPRVVHAPSNPFVKGSSLIDPIMQNLHNSGVVDYRRIHGVPAREMPHIYRDADIVLEQFRIGTYSVAAIEAMASGRIVIAHVHDQVRRHVREAFGQDVPVLQATPDQLATTITDVLARRDHYAQVAQQGPTFVRRVHDGSASAQILSDFLASGEGAPTRESA